MPSLAPSASFWHLCAVQPEGPVLPTVSVIMPVYNRATMVGQAIDSIIAQDFDDWELIVVDDGSTDGSAEAVAAYDDPRIRLVRQPQNRGGNAARNLGIDEARADLLAFLDSDDRYLPMKLGAVVRWFADHPDTDVLLDSFRKTYPDGRKAEKILRNPVLDDNRSIVEALFTRRIWKATPAIMVRRNAAIRAGKFDEALKRRQDFDFLLRLSKVARMACCDQVWWVKRYSDDAISAGLGTFTESLISFHRRHPEYSRDPVFRQGLAHDVGRHFARLIGKGKFGRARRDASALAAEFGWAAIPSLIGEGLFRVGRRRRNSRAL